MLKLVYYLKLRNNYNLKQGIFDWLCNFKYLILINAFNVVGAPAEHKIMSRQEFENK